MAESFRKSRPLARSQKQQILGWAQRAPKFVRKVRPPVSAISQWNQWYTMATPSGRRGKPVPLAQQRHVLLNGMIDGEVSCERDELTPWRLSRERWNGECWPVQVHDERLVECFHRSSAFLRNALGLTEGGLGHSTFFLRKLFKRPLKLTRTWPTTEFAYPPDRAA